MKSPNKIKTAFQAAFPYTLPIFAGFLFLGIAYGIYANVSGFPAIYPFFMSLTIFAGSMEFITVGLLLAPFDPLGAFILGLSVNARHIFYGLSMLDKYGNLGKKKWYLIFGMCDESFSINCTTKVPEGVDAGWFYTFVTILNQFYWVLGATLGGLFGNFITFDTEGLDFVMTALFVVIFLENWMKEKSHISSIFGLLITLICLLIFGRNNFIIPSMICIVGVLTIFRNRLEPLFTKEEQTL